MKVIVAGSRDFNNYPLLKEKLSKVLVNQTDVEIVSGGQVSTDSSTGWKYGADYLGEQYAIQFGHKLTRFPADWDTHGKSAGYIRNRAMAQYADALVAFWDGKSRGTKLMIELAKEMGLKYRVVMY